MIDNRQRYCLDLPLIISFTCFENSPGSRDSDETVCWVEKLMFLKNENMPPEVLIFEAPSLSSTSCVFINVVYILAFAAGNPGTNEYSTL